MNTPDDRLEFLTRDLPSPETARRFFQQFAERSAAQASRLRKSEGLLFDVLTLASYSPLLATTLIQNPEYVSWLAGKRSDTSVPGKDELLESLARFALTNSQLDAHTLLARFRRRELLRIFLRDIRRLGTIAEVTEEISNLADAILEYAVRLARQEMDNRFGPAFELDDKARQKSSEVCVVSLGKLGSKELNYSSDIDLLFIYSAEGSTSGSGSKGSVTNREYFSKFAETVTQLVGRRSGEGAAYRVDMRLRPHGSVGALALSLKETVRYYLTEARGWEQQVLIRSRASAGDASIYKNFFVSVEEVVFKKRRDANEALRQVRLSKERIDSQLRPSAAFDVKLGRGGIREIEFIAQALQLAFGGSDPWLRVPHTLISISRLADRGHLTEDERSQLANAYDFLRRLEHLLQMEHGVQTHSLPTDVQKLAVLAAEMRCAGTSEFEQELAIHSENVHNTFLRVFGTEAAAGRSPEESPGSTALRAVEPAAGPDAFTPGSVRRILGSLEKYTSPVRLDGERTEVIERISDASPKFAQMIAARPWLVEHLRRPAAAEGRPENYDSEIDEQVDVEAGELPVVIAQLRTVWSRLLLSIATADIYQVISPAEARARQTLLAEASIRAAMACSRREIARRHKIDLADPAVLALGKLGSGTLDYESDLDIVIAYHDVPEAPPPPSLSELYSRLVEVFVNLLSGMTRDGNLYRVDLRLRPHGKNGPNITTVTSFLDYVEHSASIWELLAYVQLRAVPVAAEDAAGVESKVRRSIARRAEREDRTSIRDAAREMRLKLEQTHAPRSKARDTDIKFGSGGLLDIYFVVRYLQLANLDAIDTPARSTSERLNALHNAGLLLPDAYSALSDGHAFLTELDHNLRLGIGRTSRFPRANPRVVAHIAERMGFGSSDELTQRLSLHRIDIRAAFESVLEN